MTRPLPRYTPSAADAAALRRSSRVLKLRSHKPHSWVLGVLCRLLTNAADAIDREVLVPRHDGPRVVPPTRLHPDPTMQRPDVW